MQKKIIVPILCSSGLKYRKVYRLGILETFGAIRKDSPKVIPYFGTTSAWESIFIDVIYASIARVRLIWPKQVRGLKISNQVSPVSSSKSTKGNPRNYEEFIKEASLRFDIPETPENVALRFLEMLKWILLNEQVDFIWHSNISTYLNLSRMQSFLNGNESDLYYAGFIGNYLNFDFVSGSSVCLGRDTAELVVSNQHRWDHSLLWDVALGKLLNELSIQPTLIDRIDLTNPTEVQSLSDSQLRETINFRCKSGKWQRKDHKIMCFLHERYLEID